jgi:beta-lactamase class A
VEFSEEPTNQNAADRVFAILLIAFAVVEAFFLYLIVFPDAKEQTSYPDTEAANIYDTRELEIDKLVEATKAKQRLENWQAFSDDFKQRMADAKLGLMFVDLNNPDFSLELHADQEFVAASTYKIFAAYAMFKSGQPPDCVDTMIINSDNDCPVSYLNNYGWSRLTREARELGAEHTWFDNTTHTTARDLVTVLKQVYDGSLLSEADNTRLLDDMKKQVFRDGIPAGIPEAEVADKVGFLDDLLHDAGIVYSPKGDFVLVILTDGHSWQFIADIAAEIYANI